MMDKSKILVILSPAFPEDELDFNWVPSQQLLIKTLKEKFPSLPIVVLTFLHPDYIATYVWNNVKVISFNGIHERKWRRIFLWQKIWKTLKKINREGKIGGIFSFWCGECALIGKYFGKLYKIKHYCWICGQDARATNRLIRLIRPGPDELVAMSYFLLLEFHRNHGIRPQHIIPNAIDPRLFSPAISVEKDIDILGVGSLNPLKRYGLFVSVISSLQDNIPSLHALHCGDGPEKSGLELLVEKLDMENTLHFLGEQPHYQILQLMQRTKVFLHTSEYEGYSTVCLEALYAGAHVISFCDPMEEKIPHWHIVHDKNEMIRCALDILSQPYIDFTPVLVHSMDDTAKEVMYLFEDQLQETGKETEG